jgi:elongation factor Ts
MTTTNLPFTPKDVMTLREKTGLGMMDCKAALTEAGGDMARAEEILRAKLKGKMDTRTERVTAEGRVGIAMRGSDAAIVEIRTETDFTARNPEFVAMVDEVVKASLKLPPGEIRPDASITKRIDDLRIKTGENVNFSRGERLSGGTFGTYLHHDGKRGAIVQTEGAAVDQNVLNGIATHVVGFHPTPLGIGAADVPKETVERIRAEAIAEAKEQGKPEQIAQKMAEGRVAKYLKENTLLDQPYVKDPSGKQTVKELLPKGATVRKFVRYVVGG